MQDSLPAAFVKQLPDMNADQIIAARVSSETKARVRALADRQHLSESALLKRLLEMTLPDGGVLRSGAHERIHRVNCTTRLYVRLRPEDQLLLAERALARGMPAATYISVLTRAHLRSLSPLPKPELLALRQSLAELGRLGRNINQIARAGNQGQRMVPPGRDDLGAILRVCEALRDHVKAMLRANLKSWQQGFLEGE
jgi:hypothetical protein